MRDFIVVGSGAGGAAVARELSRAGKSVLLIEGGKRVVPGKASSAYRIEKGEVEIWQTCCLGGTTLVSMGNAMRSRRCPELEEYFASTEQEMGVTAVPRGRIGRGTKLLLEAYAGWKTMPKAIDFSRCKGCGHCASGCPTGARWTSLSHISEAERFGCAVMTETGVRRVVTRSGRASGVELDDGRRFNAAAVVLAAGAIETPRILQRSGFDEAGGGLFADTFVTVGGLMKGIGMNSELGMALYATGEGYLMSPHYSALLVQQFKDRGVEAPPSDILGIMVKIEDQPCGRVDAKSVVKGITEHDARLLERGIRQATNILVSAGINEGTIIATRPRGTHPGGTCTSLIRSWVDHLPGVESLFVSDASILTGPFGIPPLLTIIAGSKLLAASLLGKA